MTENIQWNTPLALQYIHAYARFEKVNLDEQLIIKSPTKLRGDIGTAEFEYNDSLKLLIVRGLVDKRFHRGTPQFKELLYQKLAEVNNKPPKRFRGAQLEIDKTAFELNAKFPERLNLRIDYPRPIEIGKFIKEVDQLTDESYIYAESDYSNLIDEVSGIVFPE